LILVLIAVHGEVSVTAYAVADKGCKILNIDRGTLIVGNILHNMQFYACKRLLALAQMFLNKRIYLSTK
jgi:hypothetical protein